MKLHVAMALLVFAASGTACGRVGEVVSAEWDYAKDYDFKGNLGKFVGWDEIAPPPRTIADGIEEEYCTGPEWAGGRELTATGLAGHVAYGGCILDAPVPYEPQRWDGRP